MSKYELAQLNVAVMTVPLDAPEMADFVDSLDHINALADKAPGFVWRLQTDDGDATSLRPFGDNMLVNMSVWKDLESLKEYVYKSDHVNVMRRRKEWFERMAQAYLVLWCVPAGHRPTMEEAKAKLDLLRETGPSAEAFSFGHAFEAPRDMYIPPGFNTVTPYFFVRDAEGFVGFLINGFGGEEVGRTMRPDGLIANAQVRLGTATVMISEATDPYGPMASSYYLYVEDADASMVRAIDSGASQEMAVTDMSYGDRQGGVRDAWGNIWWISQRLVEEPYS